MSKAIDGMAKNIDRALIAARATPAQDRVYADATLLAASTVPDNLAFLLMDEIQKKSVQTGRFYRQEPPDPNGEECLEKLQKLWASLANTPSTDAKSLTDARDALRDIVDNFDIDRASGGNLSRDDLMQAYHNALKAVTDSDALDRDRNYSQANLLRRNCSRELHKLTTNVELGVRYVGRLLGARVRVKYRNVNPMTAKGLEQQLAARGKQVREESLSASAQNTASVSLKERSRLGETFDECKQRYGEPTKDMDAEGYAEFRKGVYHLGITFFNGKAEAIDYSRPDKQLPDDLNASMDRPEIMAILSLSGKGWKVNSQYDYIFDADTGESAVYRTGGVLTVYTQEGGRHRSDREYRHWKEEEEAEINKAKSKLKGL